ncbi:hypothetical protein SNEBB_000667 [Seison nebaliae]|nr:hypothetical protein SNEBB_000667 [Seison nebaliae]
MNRAKKVIHSIRSSSTREVQQIYHSTNNVQCANYFSSNTDSGNCSMNEEDDLSMKSNFEKEQNNFSIEFNGEFNPILHSTCQNANIFENKMKPKKKNNHENIYENKIIIKERSKRRISRRKNHSVKRQRRNKIEGRERSKIMRVMYRCHCLKNGTELKVGELLILRRRLNDNVIVLRRKNNEKIFLNSKYLANLPSIQM